MPLFKLIIEMELIVFYYIFSLLFMIGYANFSMIDKWYKLLAGLILIILFCWITMPINIGSMVYDRTN